MYIGLRFPEVLTCSSSILASQNGVTSRFIMRHKWISASEMGSSRRILGRITSDNLNLQRSGYISRTYLPKRQHFLSSRSSHHCEVKVIRSSESSLGHHGHTIESVSHPISVPGRLWLGFPQGTNEKVLFFFFLI